jgi:ATP-dependent Clp endopeptidase proteolytic subunit ClpP
LGNVIVWSPAETTPTQTVETSFLILFMVSIIASPAVTTPPGKKGKRSALPNSEVMIHQPLGGAEGQASDIEISAKHILKTRETLNRMLAKNTGQSLAKIEKDVDRNFFMDAEEAKKYGIIDKIL